MCILKAAELSDFLGQDRSSGIFCDLVLLFFFFLTLKKDFLKELILAIRRKYLSREKGKSDVV